jgi:hypothetical protein
VSDGPDRSNIGLAKHFSHDIEVVFVPHPKPEVGDGKRGLGSRDDHVVVLDASLPPRHVTDQVKQGPPDARHGHHVRSVLFARKVGHVYVIVVLVVVVVVVIIVVVVIVDVVCGADDAVHDGDDKGEEADGGHLVGGDAAGRGRVLRRVGHEDHWWRFVLLSFRTAAEILKIIYIPIVFCHIDNTYRNLVFCLSPLFSGSKCLL